MMMKNVMLYLLAAFACYTIVFANPVSGAVDENLDLVKLVSQYNDPQMTTYDLAFFLVTHNYNAIPKDGYVQVNIDGTIFKAVPNSITGMADLTNMN
jgi:hypothetical protein